MEGSTASHGASTPALAAGADAEWDRMSKKMADGNQVILRKKERCLEPRTARPLSADSTSNVTPRWWSVHHCRCGTSPVVMVNKSTTKPQAPERSASLLQSFTASHHAVKRYSCPPTRSSTSPSHSSSSSTSSPTSSCSSPTVQTSDITGRDPLGWKLNPKSSSLNTQGRAKRLSLQIPLPVIPDPNTPKPEPSPKTKPPVKPKPSRRRHSDSTALLQSLPVVMLDEICTVRLRPIALPDESDNVFSKGNQEEGSVTIRKRPPPVPEKTATARRAAHLIASSRRGCRPVTAAGSTAMQRLHVSCDSEGSTPHFPG